MEEKPTITPAEEVQPATEPTVQTIGDVLETQSQEVEKPVNTVPEHIFLEQKKARKEAERELKELKAMVEKGATKKEVSANIANIAEEYDIDPNFLDKFAETIRSETKKEFDERLSSTLSTFEREKREEKMNKAFTTHFTAALEAMPEFKNVVNAEVIKSLSMLPQNGTKTFPQLIEETYGNAISGKRTIQSTTPRGGKEPAPLDFNRASKDIEYFNEVMSNPSMKREYNEQMLKKGY